MKPVVSKVGRLEKLRGTPLIAAVCAAVLFAGFAIYSMSYAYFESEELAKAEGRLSLYESNLAAEFERFSHLTFILARDPYVMSAAANGASDALNIRLEDFAARADIDAIYLMDVRGDTIAASNHRTASSFVGQNYAFRPYFQDALAGRQGRFYAIGSTTGIPGYFIADPVTGAAGDVLGVIAIKIDLSRLEDSWQRSGERLFVANESGVVLLSSNLEWRYKTLFPLTDEQGAKIVAARQFSGQALPPLNWEHTSEYRAIIDQDEWLHLTGNDLPHNWHIHYFSSENQVQARSWLVTASSVVLLGLILIYLLTQRARRIGAALAQSEQNEAELRKANSLLAVEIEERKSAELRLQKTQGELERAGRLAALGRLSSSVTHELGQPIAAMRNHLAASEIQSGSSALTQNLQALVDRMEGITRQLKFFSRKGKDKFEEVDLRMAVTASVDLVADSIGENRVEITKSLPDDVVNFTCNKLRIEQVITNILRNAVDAVDGQDDPKVWIDLTQTPTQIVLTVRDNGHGLGDAVLTDLVEPFTTTRESGQGMGLGLAISTTIIDDHAGSLSARNRDGGGACFAVTFNKEPDHAAL